jgi:hypothetical protein
MSNSEAYVAFGKEEVPNSGRRIKTVLGLTAVFAAGFACAVLLAGGLGPYAVEQDPINAAAVLPMASKGMQRPQLRATTPVSSAMTSLSKFGVSSSPMERLALTMVAATRDTSMRAEVREAYENIDAKDKQQLQEMAEEVVVRASSIKVDELPGVTGPLGFWDPLGFSTDIPEGRLWFWREAEIKHGRVAMLAALGIQAADVWHPLWGDAGPYESAIAVHKLPLLGEKFWPAVILAAGFIELTSGVSWEGNANREPGDLGFDPLSLKPSGAKEFRELQNKEINNGRLAMFAAMGMMFQEMTANTHAFP